MLSSIARALKLLYTKRYSKDMLYQKGFSDKAEFVCEYHGNKGRAPSFGCTLPVSSS